MPESYDVRKCLCLHLRRSARQVTQFYDERLRGAGLKTTQFQLLAVISQTGPTAQQPLADLMGTDRTTLTRNLSLLEREGFVRIEKGRRDRRERAIELTAAGGIVLRKALPLWKSAQETIKERLATKSAIPAFDQMLELLAQTGSAGET